MPADFKIYVILGAIMTIVGLSSIKEDEWNFN